jgi:hypothetical protein
MLHDILTDLERQGRADIASFLPHGRAFAIHKPREWANSVMPKHFRGSHFSSFQRQLNLYNFQRITSGVDKVGTFVSARDSIVVGSWALSCGRLSSLTSSPASAKTFQRERIFTLFSSGTEESCAR